MVGKIRNSVPFSEFPAHFGYLSSEKIANLDVLCSFAGKQLKR